MVLHSPTQGLLLGTLGVVSALIPPRELGLRPRTIVIARPHGQTLSARMAAPISTEMGSLSSRYATFDWMHQWYPVAWAVDLPAGRPHRIELFDEAYAVALPSATAVRDHGAAPLAVKDACPHRLAALSEGRCTDQGYVQCAYHGWAFDSNGSCRGIPQLELKAGGGEAALARNAVESYPIMISQGMVWVCPSPWSTLISSTALPPPPPRVPEMDDPAYKYTAAVRDLPLDYSILVENILDPDHGVFAHQAKGFDLYSASRNAKQTVSVFEETGNGRLVLQSEVDATEKLLGAEGSVPLNASAPFVPRARSEFRPPSAIVSARRDEFEKSKFLTCFWVSPVGVGRTRFMAAGVSKSAFAPPRWFVHSFLNNFLDQDTHLLATAQTPALRDELKAHTEKKPFLKRTLYKYASPSEKLLNEVGKFMDASVSRMPGRYALPRLFTQATPRREDSLDRMVQHTSVCPDSMAFYKRAKTTRNVAWAAAAAMLSLRRGSAHAAFFSAAVTAAAVLGLVAHNLQRPFTYQKTRANAENDLMGIPKLFSDERYSMDPRGSG